MMKEKDQSAQPRPKLFRHIFLVRKILLGWWALWGLTALVVASLQPGPAREIISAVNKALLICIGARILLLLLAPLLIFLFVFATSRGTDERGNVPD